MILPLGPLTDPALNEGNFRIRQSRAMLGLGHHLVGIAAADAP